MRLPNQSPGVSRTTHIGAQRRVVGILPAARIRLPPTTGCGACTELTWPDGTGTGACVQECCDVLGSCQIRSCPCGSGTASSSGLNWAFYA